MKIIILLSLSLFLLTAACQKVPTVQSPQALAGVASAASSSDKPMSQTEISLNAPQVVQVQQSYNFSLIVPDGITLVSADWDFGDGSTVVNSLAPVSFMYYQSGTYQIKVTTTDQTGAQVVLHQPITVFPFLERPCAIEQINIQGPTDLTVAESGAFSVSIPACFTSSIVAVKWDFGDGSASATNQLVNHAFSAAGVYALTATLSTNSSTTPSIQLQYLVYVVDIPVSTTTTTNTTTTSSTTTTTLDPNQCNPQGATRTTDGAITSQQVACGLNGHKTMSYRDETVEQCQMLGSGLDWVQISNTNVLLQEGPCEAQSCQVTTESGVQILSDGQSIKLYSAKTPAGTCDSVSSTRTCNNGQLSGSSSAIYLSCLNGCGTFGPSGTVQSGVIVGTIQSPLVCPFGEQGFFDIYNQIADETCTNGQVSNSNIRQGDLKTPGQCPNYIWAPTEQFSACSADCGGTQNRLYECHDGQGSKVSDDHCSVSTKPIDSQVCDGNPAAVAQSQSTTVTQDAPSCAMCPKNQIGIIQNTRDVTTTTKYACVNHQVQSVGSTVTDGPWVEERYCEDLVPHRCSQDSLSNPQALGRYQWMVKCQDQNPAIKEFLANFTGVEYQGFGIDDGARHLYPTFMNYDTKKPWIAPILPTASCVAPAHIYVAAVCVSSCSTPEQEILVQAKGQSDLKKMSFIDALTSNAPMVGTLKNESSMSSRTLAKTKVDYWVTEMMDTLHPMIVFHMQSGGVLELTPNHPLLAQEGVIKLAQDFVVGESLVKLGGARDPIVSIEQTQYEGKVYNLFVKTSDLKRNIVVTNGYLNGTAFYQNEGAKYVNRSLFRHQLSKGVLEP